MGHKKAKVSSPANHEMSDVLIPEVLPISLATDPKTAIQLAGSVDGNAMLAAMHRRDVDEAQLRVLVHETKRLLREDLEHEIPVLERMQKALIEAQTQVTELVEKTDTSTVQKKMDKALKALQELDFKEVKGTVTIGNFDPEEGVRVAVSLIFSHYDHNDKDVYVPASRALRDAHAEVLAAEAKMLAQRKLVDCRRRELAETESRVVEEGRAALDRRLLGSGPDANLRKTEVTEMAKRLVAEARQRVSKVSGTSGRKQLEHKE